MRASRQASKQFLQELNILPTSQPPSPLPTPTSIENSRRKQSREFKRGCIIEARRLWEQWSKLLNGPAFGSAFPLYKYIAEMMALRGMQIGWKMIWHWRQRNWTFHKDAKYEKKKRKYNPIARRREYLRQLERYGANELQRRKREAHKLAVAAHRAIRAFKQQEQIT